MSRVVAVLVSVALVAGAFYLRARLDDAPAAAQEPATAGPTERAPGPLQGDPVAPRLVCAEELAAACSALREDPDSAYTVDLQAAGETVAALVEGEPPDLWLVPAPWPQLAELLAGAAPAEGAQPAPVTEVSEPLARSPLVLAGFAERLAALQPVCGGTVTWSCIGEQAGTPWAELGMPEASGSLRPGHLDPTQSASGLLVLASAVTSRVGRTDLSRQDLASEEFIDWFANLESEVPAFSPSSGSQVTEMLTRGLASYDVIGTTQAEATLRLDNAPEGPLEIQVLTPEPVTTADVVLVSFGAAGGLEEAQRSLAAPLSAALGDSGWSTETAPSATPLPDDAGLPDAGFLIALQERWEEVAR